MPVFPHDNIDFHFEQRGAGPVLVFTHGLSGDSADVRDLLGDSKDYSLLLWDVRGHGRTEPLGAPDAFSFARFAGDLQALMSHLGIQRAVVGGVSMGAGISTRLALDWPDLVRGLVLVRPAWLNERFPEPLRPCKRIGELLAAYGPDEGRRRFEQTAEYETICQTDPLAARLFCEQFTKARAAERNIRLQTIPLDCPIRSWDEVVEIKVPTMVIGSRNDFTHPFAYAAEWARRIPQATLEEVPYKEFDRAAYQFQVRALINTFMTALCQE